MSIAGGSESEYILNQIKDIQNRDIPLEEKSELINSILQRKWVFHTSLFTCLFKISQEGSRSRVSNYNEGHLCQAQFSYSLNMIDM